MAAMRRFWSSALLTVLAMLFASGTAAFAAPTPVAPAEAHQFDFWIGEWTVTNPAGKHTGDSKIERIANGFGILENWTGAGGYSGKSLNAWNAEKKQWQQFWVGSDGGVLELSGGLDAQGRMVLSGAHATVGGVVTERITWTPNADGSVEQLWEQSSDGGKSWRAVFDGHYAEKPADHPLGGGTGRLRRFYSLQ
ncbi:MAG TPA: hypothetical protein VG710_02570 [Opitutus sp.]|nr:hypothetical protein [Opitutus sp.]